MGFPESGLTRPPPRGLVMLVGRPDPAVCLVASWNSFSMLPFPALTSWAPGSRARKGEDRLWWGTPWLQNIGLADDPHGAPFVCSNYNWPDPG